MSTSNDFDPADQKRIEKDLARAEKQAQAAEKAVAKEAAAAAKAAEKAAAREAKAAASAAAAAAKVADRAVAAEAKAAEKEARAAAKARKAGRTADKAEKHAKKVAHGDGNGKGNGPKFAIIAGLGVAVMIVIAIVAGGQPGTTPTPGVSTDPSGNVIYSGEAKDNKGKVEAFFKKHMAAGHAVTITPEEMVAVDVKTQKVVGKQSLYGGYIDTQTGTWSLSEPKKPTPKK